MMKAGFEVVDHYTHVGENEYSHDQRLTKTLLQPEALFHPSLLDT